MVEAAGVEPASWLKNDIISTLSIVSGFCPFFRVLCPSITDTNAYFALFGTVGIPAWPPVKECDTRIFGDLPA